MARNTLTLKQAMALSRFIDTVITRRDDNLYEYRDGRNEKMVAAEAEQTLGFPVTEQNVKRVRNEVYGDLYRANTAESFEQRIAALEARVTALEERLGGD